MFVAGIGFRSTWPVWIAAILVASGQHALAGDVVAVEDATPAVAVTAIEIESRPSYGDVYIIGESITVKAVFNREVLVDQTYGTPTVGLTIGRNVRHAVYTQNASPEAMSFVYVVSDVDVDVDGIEISDDSLQLNDARIWDLSKRDVVLTHGGVSGGAEHKVDGVRPKPVAIEATGSRLRVTWDEMLNEQSTPSVHAFSVFVDSSTVAISVSEVAVLGHTVHLRLDVPVQSEAAITVEYTPPLNSASPISDIAGNAALAARVKSPESVEVVQSESEQGKQGQDVNAARTLAPETMRQIEEILAAKSRRSPSQRKVGSDLLDAAHNAREAQLTASPDGRAQGAALLAQMVEVDIRGDVTPAVLTRIGDLGGKVVNSFPRYGAIRALLPLSEVETLALEDAVTTIRTADQATTHLGIPTAVRTALPSTSAATKVNTSEGDTTHAADVARREHGVDGTGIGIGVLSDGVDSLVELQESGDLPSGVTVLRGQAGEGSEGTAMLEIVHDLAPGANLYFATAFGSQASFASNIEALCDAGADVIVDDIRYFREAVFQDDDVARAINTVVAEGCFYFSSAGNSGNLNDGESGTWEGDFVRGEDFSPDGNTLGTAHAFADGVSENEVTRDTRSWFFLKWSDPLGASSNDYDLFLVAPDGTVEDSSTNTQDGTQDPVESIWSQRCIRYFLIWCTGSENVNHEGYRLVVVRTSDAEERYLRVNTNRGRLAIGTAGATSAHNAAANAFGVAAVDVRRQDGSVRVFDGTESVERFSSDGPRRMFFEQDGTPITPGNFLATGGRLLQKPDLTAADGVSTATPGFGDFHGTSAAAPHAAAIATLMLEAAGGPRELTRAELRAGMAESALDIEAAGTDRDAGMGIVMAPAAVAAVAVPKTNRNRVPEASGLADRIIAPGESVTINLAQVFTDPDGDPLTYSVLSNGEGVDVVLSGSGLTLSATRSGRVDVTVTATDASGLSVAVSFAASTGERDYDLDDDGLIEVASLAQLDAMRYDLDGDGAAVEDDWLAYYRAFTEHAPDMGCPVSCIGYELAAALDFDANGSGTADAGDPYWNGGSGWMPIGSSNKPFEAVFEGNGLVIANLFIHRPDEDEVGLFGSLGSFGTTGVVRRVGMTHVMLTGRDLVGGIAGHIDRLGEVQASYVLGRITGRSGVGGLLGESEGEVAGSYAGVAVSGDTKVGGLVGDSAFRGRVVSSYATGRVLGDRQVGGLAGYLRDEIRNSYTTGSVSGDTDVGGLVGDQFASDIHASYWDTTTTGLTSGLGEGLTTVDLQAPTTYEGSYRAWNADGDDPWDFGTENDYPVLKADLDGDDRATWQEFGYQIRAAPVLALSTTTNTVRLTWTEPDLTHWTPVPAIEYAVYRDAGDGYILVAQVSSLEYIDEDITSDIIYSYQVAVVVNGGEASRSARMNATPGVANSAPVPLGMIPDQTMRVGDAPVVVDLSGAFRDPDGDELSYTVSSSAVDVASASVSGTEIHIEAVQAGNAVVTVTATDTGGSNTSSTHAFSVTVLAENTVDYDRDDDGLIEIATLAQLDAVRYDLDGDGSADESDEEVYAAAYPDRAESMGCGVGGCIGYELDADLDFDTNGSGDADAGDAHWNAGAGWEPIGDNSTDGRFTATFDGNGRLLVNLHVSRGDYTGLFGAVGSAGVVRRVALGNVDVTGASYVGAVAGRIRAGGVLYSSYAAGRVSGDQRVGGLVGRTDGRVVASFATTLVSGSGRVGGLVGHNGISGRIEASYAAGRVSGEDRSGGLVGDNDGAVTTSYATSRVSGERYVGGIAGDGLGDVAASYWDTRTSGHAQGTRGSGMSTADLTAPTDYTGIYATWNVAGDGDNVAEDPWSFGSSDQYPVLAADMDGDGTPTWEEFGRQVREGPALTATVASDKVVLTWTAVDSNHWTPAPGITYSVYRSDADGLARIASDVSAHSYEDDEQGANDRPAYQIAAIVEGGEATRSAEAEPPAPADTEAPTVESMVSSAQHPTKDAFTVTITFSEAVTGLVQGEIDVTGGTASNFSGSDARYAITITPDSDIEGDITISVPADAVRDLADNGNIAASDSFAVDTHSPTLTPNVASVAADTLTLVWTELLHPGPVPADVFTVTGGSVVSRRVTRVSADGNEATLILSPAVSSGETGIAVNYSPTANDSIRDAVGNPAAAFIDEAVINETADHDAPTIASITSSATHPVKDAFTVTVAFSEPVTGLTQDEIEVVDGTGSGFSGSEANYQLRIDPDPDLEGVVMVTIPADAAEDAAHNGNAAGSETFAVDTLSPVLAANNAATLDAAILTLSWSEPLDPNSTPMPGAFAVTGGGTSRSVTSVSVNGTTVRLNISPAAVYGEAGISVNYVPPTLSPLTDQAGNLAPNVSDQPVANATPDTEPPTVAISSIASHPTKDAFRVTIIFSETVTGLAVSDLDVTGGTASGFSGSDESYGIDVQPDTGFEGVVTVSIAAEAVEDASGNGNLAHSQRFAVDTRPPTLAPNGGVAVDGSALTLTWDEALDGDSVPAASAFSVAGGRVARTVTNVSVSGGSVHLTVDTAAEHGETGIEVGYVPPTQGAIQDRLGNLAAGFAGRTVTNRTTDGDMPGVASISSNATHPTKDRFTVTIVFSEAVSGLTGSEIEVSGGSGSGFSGTSATYALDVEPDADYEGDVTLTVPSGVAEDGAGNGNTAHSETFAVDTRAPTLATATADGSTLTLAWNEELDQDSTPTHDAFVVSGGQRQRSITAVAANGDTMRLTITPAASYGEQGIIVTYVPPARNPVTDTAGNRASAFAGQPVGNDTPDSEPPMVLSITSSATHPTNNPFTVTIIFSEAVSGLARTGIEVENGDASNLTGSGAMYTLDVDPAADIDGSLGITIVADAALDAAGLGNEKASAIFLIDTKSPEVDNATLDGAALTLTWSEPLDGRSTPPASTFSLSGSVARSVTGTAVSGNVVHLTVDPAAVADESDISLSYDASDSNRLRDSLGNVAAAFSALGVQNDTTLSYDYDGNDDGLIEIRTLVQLDAIRYDVDGDGKPTVAGATQYDAAFPRAASGMGCGTDGCVGYELRADLDFDTNGSGVPDAGDLYWNDGEGWAPIGTFSFFKAMFDGNGHTMSNFFTARDDSAGLFGATSKSSVISRIGLVGVDVAGGRTGALVGQNGGTIVSSYVSGRVSGSGATGGLVGWNTADGVIRSSYAAVQVKGEGFWVGGLAGFNGGSVAGSYATGAVTGGGNLVGGLVGDNAGTIRGCYATGGVYSTGDGIGGLVGRNDGTIAACLSTGRVRGRSGVGGLAGWGAGDVEASYWDTETSGHTDGDMGMGVSTAALQDPTGYTGVFAGWNLDLDGDVARDNPWRFGTSLQYPALVADLDNDSQSTWQEFGYQLREGPTLSVEDREADTTLTWTAVDTSHWSQPPTVTYAVNRDDVAIASDLDVLEHVDETVGSGRVYQVTASVSGGEATRSARTTDEPAENRPPAAVGSLPDRTLGVGDPALSIEVSVAFNDPDGDLLTYSADSSAPAVLEVVTSRSQVTLTPVATGTATVTVTATDPDGSNTTATQSFVVTVRATATIDYDLDDDGLIDITTLAQLDAVRYDTDGDGVPETTGTDAYRTAFASAGTGMGCGAGGCRGYELRTDLDFDTDGSGAVGAGDTYWNDGAGWLPIREFSAIFDGNGQTIGNLLVNRPGNAGLFVVNASSGVIRNLGLTGVNVSGNRTAGLAAQNDGLVFGSFVTGRVAGLGVTGALVGWNSTSGTIRGSYASAHVDGDGSVVGGLAGSNEGTIRRSYATGRVSGVSNVGGLLGDNSGIVVAGYAAGSVDGVAGVGGLVGRHTGDVRASYATGRVSGRSNVGGLVGWGSGGSVTAGYWDTTTSGHSVSAQGEGLDTAALQSPTGYTGVFQDWNLDEDGNGAPDEPWKFGSDSQYPALAIDMDGNGQVTWQEFGFQLREGPALTAMAGTSGVTLTWTAVDASHWSPAPAVTYVVTRDDEVLVEDMVDRRHVDANTTGIYQVAAVVQSGEASRSARVWTRSTGNLPPVGVGTLPDRTVGIEGGALTLDVAAGFEDPDGDPLTFAASSSQVSVVEVVLSGSKVTLTPLAAGTSTVTVTATDEGGSNSTATQEFEVTVTPEAATDYDVDDDGLIEIRTLSQLDAVRYDRFGRGRPTVAGKAAYARAFPNADDDMGCGVLGCSGYELSTDLNFDTDESGSIDAGDAYWNDGAGWVPINDFAARFNGNNHTVEHLFVNSEGDAGMFRQIQTSGVVERLGLVSVDVVGTRAGALAARNSGEILTSFASGHVAGDADVGGLVGSNAVVGEIRASFATVDVYGEASSTGGLVGGNSGAVLLTYATGGVSGVGEVGGLIGWNSVSGSVRASYATGRVSGGAGGSGGLVGRNSGEIRASLATGPVSGTAQIGGLVGSQSVTGETLTSYWDTDTSGRLSGEHGQGETTGGLQLPTDTDGIYADWEADFDSDGTTDDPWHFGTSAQYPALALDFDGDGQPTWQEFGRQLREGPTATVAIRDGQAHLTWNAVHTDHWSPAPQLTYTVIRGSETVTENLAERRYAEPVRSGGAARYQVAAVVGGGEASRSSWVSTNPTGNRPPVVAEILPNLTLFVDGDAVQIDISSAFRDPEGDIMAFGVSSSAPAVVGASVSDARATLTPVTVGTAVITVTATDQEGSNEVATQTFVVTVRAEAIDYDDDDDGLIEIRTLAQLDAVRHDPRGSGRAVSSERATYALAFPAAADDMGCADGCDGYELLVDLDFDTDGDGVAGNGDEFWHGGDGWQPIDGYSAIFNGNGNTLSNLLVDRDGGAGLFLELGFSAEVQQLGLVGANVTGDSAGVLAATSRGSVTSCFATGQVTGDSDVGGLIGSNRGTVASSFATSDVTGVSDVGGLVGRSSLGEIDASYATGRVTGESDVGGLVGRSSLSEIVASYATGRVMGETNVGGLVGRISLGEIVASYATGRVTGDSDVGGLLGSRSLGEIVASYWDTGTSGSLTGDHGQGETTAGLQAPTGHTGIYLNWNADLDGDDEGDDPWHFGTDAQYPVLAVDFDDDGQATWQEFGRQLREGPVLTATAGQDGVALTWTAVDTGHWNPAPAVTYAVTRNDTTIADGVAGLRHDDADATPGQAHTYQISAVVSGGEASRSARTRTNPTGNRPPVVAETLPDLTLFVDGGSVTVDVADTFQDPEGDALTYAASSSALAVATVDIDGSEATISPVAAGETTITVTATDQDGSNTVATQTFAVTVRAEAIDYDDDDDGLIDIRTLAQLDAVRHDPRGSGRAVSSERATYALAFPAAADDMGCADGCDGYELLADLDFDTDGDGVAGNGDEFWHGGAGWLPIDGYSAIFAGNGNTLSNLLVDRDGGAGLFLDLGFSAEVRQLGLVGANVTGDSAGALAATSRGSVTSCFATGQVTGDSDVGGLIGSNRGHVASSFVTSDVTGVSDVGGLVGQSSLGEIDASYATGRVMGETNVGGLVGRSSLSEIIASYATGRVMGETNVGGLIGRSSLGEIIASYATGRVTGDSDVGGLLGSRSLGEIVASYWDTGTSGSLTGDHGQGETTAGLKAPTGYTGIYLNWNADIDGDDEGDDPWHFGTDAQYPVLAVDFDDDGQATWQEFGYQLREGPSLTATAGQDGVALTWTAVDTGHWNPAPAVTYAVTRNDTTIADGVAGLRHDDADATPDQTHTYQVAAVMSGGEASRSAIESVDVGGNATARAHRQAAHHSTVVTIPDDSLRAAIEVALGKSSGETIHAGEMAELVVLNLRDARIVDLTGLEHAHNLVHIDLGFNALVDMSSLALLRELKSLNLDASLTDMVPVLWLPNLTHLSLRSNSIVDLSAVAALTRLTHLDIGDNKIADLYPLSELTDLMSLYADNNQIRDLAPVGGLVGLQMLNLASNQISDVFALSSLSRLEMVFLGDNLLSQLEPLSGLPLVTLELSGNAVSNIQPLSYLENLEWLDLSHNQVCDFHPVTVLLNLVWLDISGNCADSQSDHYHLRELRIMDMDERVHIVDSP